MKLITDILVNGERNFGDLIALRALREDGSSWSYTFREVSRQAHHVANYLRTQGIRRGHHVAILSENRPEWAIAYFGILLAHGVVIPVDTKLKSMEIRNILRHSRTMMLFASDGMLAAAREACAELSDIRIIALDQITQERPEKVPVITPDADSNDTAVISFTSGTTGTPKGIMLTHRNILSNVMASCNVIDCSPRDRFLSLLPLNHTFEKTAGLLVPLYMGACVTYIHAINPRTVTEAMQKTGTTFCLIVPAIARLFYKRILMNVEEAPSWKQAIFWKLYGLSRRALGRGINLGPILFRSLRKNFGGRMRCFISGGAPLDPKIAEFFSCVGLPILQGYGLTETAPVVSCNKLHQHRIGSVGVPLDGVEVKIEPRNGCDSSTGEILVRGPNVMAGYFNDSAATSHILQGGWLHTGDLGRIDANGFLYIVGRVKDVIISDLGKNVYPEEVEAEIVRIPLVKEACVLGVRKSHTSHHGEEVAALIVPDEEASKGKSPQEISNLIRLELKKVCTNLADYKRPKCFCLCPEDLPKTTTLKLKKAEIAGQIDKYPFLPL